MPRIQDTIADAQRFRQIVTELFSAGFDTYVDAMRLRYLVPLSARWKFSFLTRRAEVEAEPVEVRLRKSFEKLGPTFMKLGQMLSVRPDLVGEEAASEFSKLQESADEVSFDEVIKVIERELGSSWNKRFKRIDKKPIASASIAQTHRAVTKKGTEVVIKVQRPEIREMLVRDIHLIALSARLLERHVPASRVYQPVKVVQEFADWTIRELDFTIEAAHMERLRGDFAAEERMHVPGVFWKLSSKRVLTLEYIKGVHITNVKAIRAKKIQRKVVAEFVVESFLHQFLVTGFFHGDPHPGNLLAMPGGGILLYDFGIVGYLTPGLRSELLYAFTSYVEKDNEKFINHILKIVATESDTNVDAFRRDLRAEVDAIMFRPTAHKGIPIVMYRVILIGARHNVRFPTDFVLLAKVLLTLESVIRTLDPKVNLDKAMEPVFTRLTEERLDPRSWAPQAQETVFSLGKTMLQLPERTLALLKRVEEGNVSVRIDLDELYSLKEEFDRENDLRVFTLVVIAIFIGSTFMIQSGVLGLPWALLFGKIGLVVSGILVIWIFIQSRKKPA